MRRTLIAKLPHPIASALLSFLDEELLRTTVEKKPELVDSPIQTVIPNTQAKQWLDLIQRIAPEQYKAILFEYDKNPF